MTAPLLNHCFPSSLLVVFIGTAGCFSDATPSGTLPGRGNETTVSSCDLPVAQLVFGGVGRDGIVALTNPETATATAPGALYLRAEDRVVGLLVGDQWIAVPHNVLWYHEVVNLDMEGMSLVVTYCPLTGSSLVFDRTPVAGVEFGVSGLLYNNNLILFDRSEPASLWPQMSRRARCGPQLRTELPMVAATDMTWAGWRALHPDTRVVVEPAQFGFDYQRNPLGPYEMDHSLIFFPMGTLDGRLPAKERVVGVPQGGDGGMAYPFSSLGADQRRALHQQTAAGPVVVLWDGSVQGAAVFQTTVGGEPLTFEVRDGRFWDLSTGSEWGLDGVAISGSRTGQQLLPFAEAYTAFWFAWAAFHPETVVWAP